MSMNFFATSSSVTLQFKDLAVEFPTGNDLGLDAVDVEPAATVPEPSYTLLFALALAALYYVLRPRCEVA
jgi:hypothetical protein